MFASVDGCRQKSRVDRARSKASWMAHLQTDLSNRWGWRDLTDLLHWLRVIVRHLNESRLIQSHNKAEYPTQGTEVIMFASVDGCRQKSRVE
jgi:hypothetical protein